MTLWKVLSSIERNWRPILLLITLLTTTTLSLGRFGQLLWRDEASSVWFARLSPTTLVTGLCDPHPPGYYLLLQAWLAGGEREFWLRWPSLLAAVLAVALTYRLGAAGCGYRCAWLAALLLALHPLQNWYAAEVRMYTLAQCLGLLLVWLGWRLLSSASERTIQGREAVLYWAVAVVGLGIDYIVLLPFGLLQLLWLIRGRPQVWRWLSLQTAVLVSAAFLWLDASRLYALRHSYPPLLIAVQANRLGFDLTPARALHLLQLILIGLILASLGLAWFWSRRPDRCLDRPLFRLLVLGGWLALLLLAALPRAFTVKRQLIVLLPYLALLAGYTLARLPRPAGELVAGLGLVLTLLILPGHPREPWRVVVTDLVQQQETGQAAVIWVDELAVPVFDYYLRDGAREAGVIQWTPLLGRKLPQLPDLAPQPGQTLWLVTVESVYRHLMALLPVDFHRHYQLLEAYHYEQGITLYHFQRQPNPAPFQLKVTVPDRMAEWELLLPSPLDTCRPIQKAKVW